MHIDSSCMPIADELSSSSTSATRVKPELFSSYGKRSVILSLLLVLATIGVYNSISHNQFINLDDNLYVTQNVHVQSGLHWSTVRWAITSEDQANWHPLTWLSHALDWQLFGRNAGGHHYVSLLFHALNAVLLFLLLQSATGFTWRSLMVAALFALHPVNVESVAWVAERKNVLSMMFFLLALLAYGRYARKPSIGRYALVALCFVFGLMSKPQVITLPCVLLLWDYWPLQRFGAARDSDAQHCAPVPFSRLVLEKIPLFLLSAADAVITMRAQHTGNAVRTMTEYSWYARISNSIVSYVRYVGHAFWPLHLSPTYSHPGDGIPVWHVVAAVLFLLSATALAGLSRKRYLLTGWFWFLGTLVPMIGIVQVGDQAMADRYAYTSFIGLFWIAVWSLSEIRLEWRLSPRWLLAPACVALLAASFLSHRLVGYWHDSEALWTYANSLDSADFLARANLGKTFVMENRPEEGIAEFDISQRLHKYPYTEILRFADYEMRHGHVQDGAARCRRVLGETDDPKIRVVAWIDLGVADLRLNDLSAARSDFEHAVKTDPRDPGAIVGLGLVAERNGELEQAEAFYLQSIDLQQDDLAYFLLATTLEKTGRRAEAEQAYAKAQQLTPNPPELLQKVHELLP